MRIDDMKPCEIRRDDDGTFWHACCFCGETGPLDHEVTDEGRGRVNVGDVAALSVNPSVVCPHCQAHYVLRDGKPERLA